jgi:hypothetical protein
MGKDYMLETIERDVGEGEGYGVVSSTILLDLSVLRFNNYYYA